MGKIHKVLIDEATRIREDYLKEVSILADKEKKINNYQDRLKELLSNVEKYIIKNKNNDIDEEQISIDLNDELSDIEITMNRIKGDVEILDNKVKKLQTQSQNLYQKIIKKHPELSEKEIQQEILYTIKE